MIDLNKPIRGRRSKLAVNVTRLNAPYREIYVIDYDCGEQDMCDGLADLEEHYENIPEPPAPPKPYEFRHECGATFVEALPATNPKTDPTLQIGISTNKPGANPRIEFTKVFSFGDVENIYQHLTKWRESVRELRRFRAENNGLID